MLDKEFGRFDYDARGAGPTVVPVPGSCSTAAVWRSIIAEWQGRFRRVTTSLLGYGGTTERRTAFDAGMALEAEALGASLADRWLGSSAS